MRTNPFSVSGHDAQALGSAAHQHGRALEGVIRLHQGDQNIDVKKMPHGGQIPSSSMMRSIFPVLTTSPRDGRMGMPFFMV